MRSSTRRFAEFLPPAGNVDAAIAVVAFTLSGVDVPGIGSLGTLNFALTPITTAEGLNSEFGTELFALKPSGVDQQLINEANSEYFDLQPSGVEAPQYGVVEALTEYLSLQPITTVEVQAKQYTDAGSEYLVFGFTTHDCYVHATPEYEIFVFQKWHLLVEGRWGMASITKRWNVAALNTAVTIPC